MAETSGNSGKLSQSPPTTSKTAGPPESANSSSSPSILSKTSAAAHTIGNAGSYMFDSVEERERKFAEERLEAGTVSTFAQSKAHTPIDGLAKGVAALGTGLGKGFIGVFTEPIKGATEGGATGFFSGLGKGLVGLVTRPTAGVIELGVKTTEGFANTPSTLSSLVKGNTEVRCFGSPLKASLELAKSNKQRHLIVKCLDELEHSGLDKKHVFDVATHEALVFKFRESFNLNQDVNLEAIDPPIVAQLFKLFLLELPTPLVTQSVFEELMAIASAATKSSSSATQNEEEYIKKVKAQLSLLPEEHKAVLGEICIVLRKFLKSASRNGLDLSTLASSLSLCFMRPSSYQWSLDVPTDGSSLAGIINFSASPQLSADEKKHIQYMTKLIITHYQPGYVTYNLHE